MKILLDVSAVQAPLSGIGRYTCELARHLPRARGVERVRYVRGVEVQAAFDPDRVPAAQQQGKLRRRLKRLPALRGALALYRRRKSGAVADALAAYGDHIYLSPNFSIPRLAGPRVATIHDLSVFHYPECHPRDRVNYLRGEIQHAIANADHLLTDSRYVRDELIEQFGVPAQRVSRAPLGVDAAFCPRPVSELSQALAAYGLQPGQYLLCVGTLEPRKNLEALLAAHAQLDDGLRRRYPLVLVGAYGWNSRSLLQRIQAAPSGEVIYLDYVPEAQLPLLYSGAGLFCCPSHYEGFGLPVLEALASGVPVICADNSALTELAAGCAMMWAGGDPASLAGLITQCLEDRQWREQAVARGIERSRAYHWADTTAAVADALAGLAAR